MITARLVIATMGILLPYLVRIPRGVAWVEQYTNGGIAGFVFLEGFNAIAWGSLIALSFATRRPAMLVIPSVLGLGFLAWMHATLDLAADAQASIALVFIPIYALLPIAIGAITGYVLDRRMLLREHPRQSDARQPP